MNTLIIYAHPNRSSFNAAILEQVKRGLKEVKGAFTVIDLYQDHFNPVLVMNEQFKRSDLKNDPETENYRRLVQQADHLIFIYPTWWNGMPAILKGFFDRVFVSGFAFKYDGKIPKGLLKGKTAWVICTADSPGWFIRLIRKNVDWIHMRDAILKFCGIIKVKRYLFSSMKSSSERQRNLWLDHIYHEVQHKLT